MKALEKISRMSIAMIPFRNLVLSLRILVVPLKLSHQKSGCQCLFSLSSKRMVSLPAGILKKCLDPSERWSRVDFLDTNGSRGQRYQSPTSDIVRERVPGPFHGIWVQNRILFFSSSGNTLSKIRVSLGRRRQGQSPQLCRKASGGVDSEVA